MNVDLFSITLSESDITIPTSLRAAFTEDALPFFLSSAFKTSHVKNRGGHELTLSVRVPQREAHSHDIFASKPFNYS